MKTDRVVLAILFATDQQKIEEALQNPDISPEMKKLLVHHALTLKEMENEVDRLNDIINTLIRPYAKI